MTREEAWNRIDAIIEKHEVDDVYVTINNHKDYDALRFARKLLEQEPCDELDFVQPHKKMSVNLQVCKMREATRKEREGVEQYIDSIAEPCENAISRQEAIEAFQMFREYESNRSNKEWVNRIETVLNQLPPVNSQPKTGCEGCIHEKTGNNSTYPCSHCGRCYTDKYKIESEG